jgi:hypothetical protein
METLNALKYAWIGMILTGNGFIRDGGSPAAWRKSTISYTLDDNGVLTALRMRSNLCKEGGGVSVYKEPECVCHANHCRPTADAALAAYNAEGDFLFKLPME